MRRTESQTDNIIAHQTPSLSGANALRISLLKVFASIETNK